MKKLARSILLLFPKIYELIYRVKNGSLAIFYLKKVHESDFNAFNLICQDHSQLFLDIGANVGMSALSIFTIRPNAHVISFEPNPINHFYLERIAKKFENFKYYQVGLGNEEKSLIFYYPIYNGKPMTALGSFNYERAKNWLNPSTVYLFDEKKLKIEQITLKVKTLDSFGFNPEFIKIDVEGFEYQVLQGGQETIRCCKPIFLIEGVALNDKIHNFLKKQGYSAYKFKDNKFYLDDFNSDNNFFIPEEKLELIQPYTY